MLARARAEGRRIITTEKDAVKWPAALPDGMAYEVLETELAFEPAHPGLAEWVAERLRR